MGRSLVAGWNSQEGLHLRLPGIELQHLDYCHWRQRSRWLFEKHSEAAMCEWWQNLANVGTENLWLPPGMDNSGQSPWDWCTWDW